MGRLDDSAFLPDDDREDHCTIDVTVVIPINMAAIKELDADNMALKAEVADLKTIMTTLEELVQTLLP